METKELLQNFYVFENRIDKSNVGIINWELLMYYHLAGLPNSKPPNQIVFRHTTPDSWLNTQESHLEIFLDKVNKAVLLLNELEKFEKQNKPSGSKYQKALGLYKSLSLTSENFADKEVKDMLVNYHKATVLFGPDFDKIIRKS